MKAEATAVRRGATAPNIIIVDFKEFLPHHRRGSNIFVYFKRRVPFSLFHVYNNGAWRWCQLL